VDEFFGNFIVQALEDGGDASTLEAIVACFIALDGIGIIVVEDEDVVVAATRDEWEASREVIAYESFLINLKLILLHC
jgi:hypothetical protein